MKEKLFNVSITAVMALSITGCNGDGKDGMSGLPGDQGQAGIPGVDGNHGSDGIGSLIEQRILPSGSAQCTKGGLRIDSGADSNRDGQLDAVEIEDSRYVCNPSLPNNSKHFNRIATFPVCLQLDGTCNTDQTTATEIVAASPDGMTLIYSDSPAQQVGFVDITDPSSPNALGLLPLPGEPTAVAVTAGYALVGVNTSEDFVNVSGELAVVDIMTRTLVHTIDLGGQPDSVAVSPDGRYAAVVIENERDEDLDDGYPPQTPPGGLVIICLDGAPDAWTTTMVDMVGLADLYPGDPEPEYVDINHNNIAVVTLQENNHIVLVDLADASVLRHFSAGGVDLERIDVEEEGPAHISLTTHRKGVLREPDGVSWINGDYFVTADEGDLGGGSRGFTVFDINGEVAHTSGHDLDHLAVRLGHYPDGRSGNKGNEPENVEVGVYGNDRYLFVASERASLIFVYDVADPVNPVHKQTLPAAVSPEGVLAIPSRNLLVAASEGDGRGDAYRSAVNIYNYSNRTAQYPALISDDRVDGTPIPWGALSSLTADPTNEHRLYSIDDSYYQRNRIFTIDTSGSPARIINETSIRDTNDVLLNVPAAVLTDLAVDATDVSRTDVFDEADLARMINDDKTVNLDPEGIVRASDGGFWIASEGIGTIGDELHPINSLNMVLKTDSTGIVEEVFTLPDDINASQVRFGFEGIAEYSGKVYVAFQRAWIGESDPRIGVLDPSDGSWNFYFYPLNEVASQNGGWVGLSDIIAIGNGQFMVVERDNQGGLDAAIKRLYTFDITNLNAGETVEKILVHDLVPTLNTEGRTVPDKVEGLAMTPAGNIWISNDNDGVDDSSGENYLINLGRILQ